MGAPQLQKVDFDVAVTAAEKEAGGGNFAVEVVMAKIGLGNQGEKSSAMVSRIQFQVVVDLPHYKSEES